MHDLAVSTQRIHPQAAVATPRGGSHPGGFQDLLAAACDLDRGGSARTPHPGPLPPSEPRIVQAGECLSSICAGQLKAQGASASPQAIQAAVRKVALANHIADPDRIRSGQPLDLSGLARAGSGPAPGQATPGPWAGLVEGAVAVSSAFGLRKDPFTGRMRQHNGIDVAAPAGSAVTAFSSGRVLFSGWKVGYGNTVVIRGEDGVDSLYGHVSKALVQVGEQVDSHTPIARVGSNGRSTGPHLHFEVRRNGQALDPATQVAVLKT